MMRLLPSIVVVLLAMLFMSSCQNPSGLPSDMELGQIKGLVIDANGEPVENASVSSDPETKIVLTAEDGTFLMPVIPVGEYTLTASRRSMPSGRANVKVESMQNTLVTIVMDGGDDSAGNDDRGGDDGKDDDGKDDDGKDDDGKDDDGKDDDGKDDDGKDDDGKDDDDRGGDDRPRMEGLLVHLKLNGDAIDAAGTLQRGKVVGATPTTDRFGNRGAAMMFDGRDDYIEFERAMQNPTVSLPTTWSFWLRPNRANALLGQHMQAPLGSYLHPSGTGIIFLWENGKFASVYTNSRFENYVRIDHPLPADGEWHHVVMRVTPDGMEVFYDGNSIGTVGWKGRPSPAVTQEGLRLGLIKSVHPREPLRPYAGAIDDVMIFRRPLSNEEIARIYRAR